MNKFHNGILPETLAAARSASDDWSDGFRLSSSCLGRKGVEEADLLPQRKIGILSLSKHYTSLTLDESLIVEIVMASCCLL